MTGARTRWARPARTALLAHALFAVGVLGVVLVFTTVAPNDGDFAFWRWPVVLLGALVVMVGWILAWKRPRVPIGWMMLALGVLDLLQAPATTLALAWRVSDPVAAGWAIEVGPESSWTWIVVLGTLVALIPLRFPTGGLPSPRWRWVWWTSVGLLVVIAATAATFMDTMWLGVPNPTYVDWGASLGAVQAVVELALVAVFVAAIASVVVRYRRGDAIERAQLRWLFWAASIIVGLGVVGGVENAIFGGDGAAGVAGLVAHLLDLANDLTFSLIPLAILVAVLRSRLYAIDRIVSRTAAYSIVTLTSVLVYLAVVLVASLLLPGVTQLGVAAATLATATLFLPLLRIVRRTVDRRFDRAQYDAQRVVEQFGERVRTGADPFTAGQDLVRAVELALQPAAIGMWVPVGARGLSPAAPPRSPAASGRP